MSSILFEGEKHKITTDGKTFFLYLRSIKNHTKEIWGLLSQNTVEGEIYDEAGRGVQIIITGANASWQKTVTVTGYDDFPKMLIFNVSYK